MQAPPPRFQFSTIGLLRFVTGVALILGLVLWLSRLLGAGGACIMLVVAVFLTFDRWRRTREPPPWTLTWLELVLLYYAAIGLAILLFWLFIQPLGRREIDSTLAKSERDRALQVLIEM